MLQAEIVSTPLHEEGQDRKAENSITAECGGDHRLCDRVAVRLIGRKRIKMSGVGYTMFEYLIWIAVALALIIVLFVCLAIAVAISSAVNPLAAKWKPISNAKPDQAPEPNPARPVRSDSLRSPQFLHARKARRKPLLGKLPPPESPSAPKHQAR